MSRVPLVALVLSVLAMVIAIASWCVFATKLEASRRDIADLTRRTQEVESVYESSECVLMLLEGEGCEMEDGSMMFLGQPDPDGEVRHLIRRSMEGAEISIGQLGKELSYVRALSAEGEKQGFLSSSQEGLVEVYAARPALSKKGDEERLPIMIKNILQK